MFFGNSKKFKVVITNRGLKGSGRYIGRHKGKIKGIFGNPFPTKPSKFSKKVFPLNHKPKKCHGEVIAVYLLLLAHK